MKWQTTCLMAVILFALFACGSPDIVDEGDSLDIVQEIPTQRILTPVPLPEEHLSPLGSSRIARVWANTGEDKVTREELRASQDPNGVLNSVWDGTGISLFGARNEVVSFNLVLEAPSTSATNLEVSLIALEGPDGARITTTLGPGADPFDYVGRDIELFYVRYLEIRGISTDLFIAGYDYDERHIPERCRRPLDEDGEPVGGWNERPCHNLYYPDIAVPLELHKPFDIPAGASQAIWGDIYIPRDTPPGDYSGTIEIHEEDTLTWEIPITLQVFDFTLPDLPTARTMLYASLENIGDRYLGQSDLPPDSEDYLRAQGIMDRHFQLAHRHRISLIGDTVPLEHMEEVWGARLSGELFTPEEGYAGPGAGVGNNVYSIGTYGDWSWQDGGRADMWAETDAWATWFEKQVFETPTEYFLYLIDESDDYERIETWAQWIESNPGPGREMMSMATLDLPDAVDNIPSLDIPASWARFGVTGDWQAALSAHRTKPGTRFYLYNSNRPATGSFAIEDEGVALRTLPWAQYKLGIDRWFYWEATYYSNYQCYDDPEQALTDVYGQAQTYGCLEGVDESLGETGWNYLNGDGVLMYPGTDLRFPAESYGVMGPFASLRLKHWRRGIQDADYLALAAQVDPKRTTEIVMEMVPAVLWELGVDDPDDPTYVYADISWPTDPDLWETVRRELAQVIATSSP